MCRVCGWLSSDGSTIDRPIVEAMTSLLRRRGPHGYGHHFEDRVAFALWDRRARRLLLARDPDALSTALIRLLRRPTSCERRAAIVRRRLDLDSVVRTLASIPVDVLARRGVRITAHR